MKLEGGFLNLKLKEMVFIIFKKNLWKGNRKGIQPDQPA
jgi:hypothetical protein